MVQGLGFRASKACVMAGFVNLQGPLGWILYGFCGLRTSEPAIGFMRL